MSRSLIDDAFAHHVWATVRLVDSCLVLSPEQLATAVPGTYGSILETMRHIVESDSFDLFVASGERTPVIHSGHMDPSALRAAMEGNGVEWSRLLRQDLDHDAVQREVDETDGFQRDAPLGLRFAQALHHGNDHRSQICTALTTLGVQPPAISVWDFGLEDGRVAEVLPRS